MSARAWTVPSLYAALAVIGGLMLPRLESRLLPGLAAGMSVPAAMAIYSSIASGMIALTGIVFSLVFVMVQFSATAYSPRLVLWVARRPLIFHALGVFTATFLYAVCALAWVDRRGTDTVPLLSALVVVILLLASVCMLIGLIDRIALLSINRMLSFTGDQGRAAIERIYPEPERKGDTPSSDPRIGKAVTQSLVHHGRPVVIQSVDIGRLVALARGCEGVIEVVAAVGDSVADAATLLNVLGAHGPIDERALRRAVVVGEERAFEQDPKYAIRLIVDIAIRALSPAINDPTTAVQALDQIGDLLLRLSRRRLELGAYCDDGGQPRLIVPFPTWDDFLRLSLEEIRTCGAGSVQVMRRMTALIADLLAVVPASRRAALESWHERLERTIARTFANREDQLEASAEDRQGLGAPRRRPAA